MISGVGVVAVIIIIDLVVGILSVQINQAQTFIDMFPAQVIPVLHIVVVGRYVVLHRVVVALCGNPESKEANISTLE